MNPAAFIPLHHWYHRAFPVLDFETTGTDPHTARPVSVALMSSSPDGALVTLFSSLIDCGVDVPEAATAVHGITTERVRADGIKVNEAIQQVAAMLDAFTDTDAPLVAFNVPYDWTLLHAEARRQRVLVQDLPCYDPLLIDRTFDKYRKGKRTLSDLVGHYGVKLDAAHTAGGDCAATAQIARLQVEKYYDLQQEPSANMLHEKQVDWYRKWRAGWNKWAAQKAPDKMIAETEGWPFLGDRP